MLTSVDAFRGIEQQTVNVNVVLGHACGGEPLFEALTIETNPAESVFRVRVGPSRKAVPVRVADGLLVELDEQEELAGLWLVGVPPFPNEEPVP